MTTQIPILRLASQSPRRQEILKNLNIDFEVITSPYKESFTDVDGLSPCEQAIKLASLKAFYASKEYNDGLVIGADTIVVLENNQILGKPRNKSDAEEMLNKLSGKMHYVITGISIVDCKSLRTVAKSSTTKVFFRKLQDKEIRRYIQTNEPYDKAGGYAIQGLASIFIERIEGCYYNVVGFPIPIFYELLNELGYNIFDFIKVRNK